MTFMTVTYELQGKLKPHVSHTYSLADTPQALDALLHRRAIGKLVIRP